MKKAQFKYLIIGGGSAGYNSANYCRQYHDSIAIVDNSKTLGGLCILNGCMPSKTLIYAGEILNNIKHAGDFGINIGERAEKIDPMPIWERKREMIGRFAKWRQDDLNADDLTLYQMGGKFTSKNTFELEDGTELEFEKCLIATGSRVMCPNVHGLGEVPYLISDDILNMKGELPKSMIVLGGGVVACELGQFLHRVGVEVTIIQRSPHILKNLPSSAAGCLEQKLRDEGVSLYTHTSIQSIEHEGGKYRITFMHLPENKQVEVKADALFNALGRVANTDKLGLEDAGVDLDDRGQVITNDFQQTTNDSIYAAGDCAGPHEIVHVAIRQGETATEHAFGAKAERIHYDDLVSVIFTDPQIAVAGFHEADLEARGLDYVSASYAFEDHGKSITMNATDGYVKLLADPSDGRLLGAECVGKDAAELIHIVSLPITLGARVGQLLKAHWYHPTLAEIWTYPMEEIVEKIKK